jgi:hypothetical protein
MESFREPYVGAIDWPGGADHLAHRHQSRKPCGPLADHCGRMLQSTLAPAVREIVRDDRLGSPASCEPIGNPCRQSH